MALLAGGMRRNQYGKILHNRDLMLLVVGRSVSWYGNALAPMAMVFAVLDLRRSVTSVSLVVVSRSIPQLAFVLVGGVIADRRHRRLMLILGSVMAAVSQAALAWLLRSADPGLAVLVALSMINGTSAALAGPAAGAIFRAVVPPEDWRSASVLDRGGMQLALLLGMSSGGVLIAAFGPALAIGIDAATFATAAVCYLGLRDPGSFSDPVATFVSQLRAGFGYLWQRTWLVVMAVQTLITGVVFAAGLQILGPVVADATFGRAAFGLSASFQIGGALLGVLLVGILPARGTLLRTITMSGAVSLPLLVLALGPGLLPVPMLAALFAAMMLVTGCCGELAGVWENLATLRHVDQEMIGRMGSFGLLASVGGLPLGEILAAPLHALLGTSGAFIPLIIAVLAVVGIGVGLPGVRSVDYGLSER